LFDQRLVEIAPINAQRRRIERSGAQQGKFATNRIARPDWRDQFSDRLASCGDESRESRRALPDRAAQPQGGSQVAQDAGGLGSGGQSFSALFASTPTLLRRSPQSPGSSIGSLRARSTRGPIMAIGVTMRFAPTATARTEWADRLALRSWTTSLISKASVVSCRTAKAVERRS
jgi:hypothetical protein